MVEKVNNKSTGLASSPTRSNVVGFERLRNKSVLLVGAAGFIGSHILSELEQLKRQGLQIDVTITSHRDEGVLQLKRLHPKMNVQKIDLSVPIKFDRHYDFVLDVASPAGPGSFASDPVGTMIANFDGVKNLLVAAKTAHVGRFLYISSGEVYGSAQEELLAPENFSGYIDYLNPRSCYPSSKRAAETLCSSFAQQYSMNIVIARPSHVFGPGFRNGDNRISASFFLRALSGKDIVLESTGLSKRTYVYVDDCASGILSILTVGKRGEAYNVTNSKNVTTIADFAEQIAKLGGIHVLNETKECKNTSGSIADSLKRVSMLDDTKIRALGWRPRQSLASGIQKTFDALMPRNCIIL